MPSFYQLNCPIFRSWPWLTKRDNHFNKNIYRHYRLFTYDDVYNIIAVSYEFAAEL